MGRLLERYMDGERNQAWDEMRALGADIQSKAIQADAFNVAALTMNRAKANVATIVSRLQNLNYEFQASSPLEGPVDATIVLVNDLDSKLGGALPLSLRAWYSFVGAVDFRGRHPTLSHVCDGDRVPEHFTLADPLVIAPVEFLLEGFSDWSSGFWGDQQFQLELSPDDLHKANVSGGSYCVALNGVQADAIFLDWHSLYFVDYLRCVFAWGGFPGWERHPSPPMVEIQYLTGDLLPI